jgi:hypothetical protein
MSRNIAGLLHKSGEADAPLLFRLQSALYLLGYTPPSVQTSDPESIHAALMRMACATWWRRQGRKLAARGIEAEALAQNAVNAKRSPYVSAQTLAWFHERRRQTQLFLDETDLVAEDGEVISLAVAAAASVSNPEHRRAEMMIRVRGMDALYAPIDQPPKIRWHKYMVTWTLPSRWHRCGGFAGNTNSKHDAVCTPRAGHQEILRQWAQARANLHKRGIKTGEHYAGVRVAEPHHDGTPHWHIVLFIKPEHAAAVRAELFKQALMESPTEKGAEAHRMRIEIIRGDAAAYCAAYISKNIDGETTHGEMPHGHIDEFEGESKRLTDASDGATRAQAWARVHGIRQFQFFGAERVTIYRELRRARAPVQLDLIEPLREPADRGDWRAYTRAAQNLPKLKFHHEATPRQNAYGETLTGRLLGVAANDAQKLITHDRRWVSLRRDLAANLNTATFLERLGPVSITVSRPRAAWSYPDGLRDFYASKPTPTTPPPEQLYGYSPQNHHSSPRRYADRDHDCRERAA